jgi:hypothetical protein
MHTALPLAVLFHLLTSSGLARAGEADPRFRREAGRRLEQRAPLGFAWSSEFDGAGFRVQPRIGRWSFGLALESWGFEGAPRRVEGVFASCAGGRAPSRSPRDLLLTEWFVNRAPRASRRLQRARAAAGDGERLVLRARVARGELAPRVDEDGRGAASSTRAAASACATTACSRDDAGGRAPPTRGWSGSARCLRIVVDTRAARSIRSRSTR